MPNNAPFPAALAAILIILAHSAAIAQSTAPANQPQSSSNFGITGDWLGSRTHLQNEGLTFAGTIDYDYSKNLTGGISTARDAGRELLNLSATLATDQFLNWRGGTFFINLQNHEGSDGTNSLTGDAQRFDNQDAPRNIQISELWYQQLFAADKLRLKLGRIDANSEFANVANASEFLNSSYGASPAILAIPTYPDNALGANLFWTPTDHFYLGAGAYYSNRSDQSLILSGHPNTFDPTTGGIFTILELGTKWTLTPSILPGRLALGGYDHNGQFKRFTGPPQTGEAGMYIMFDQTLWQSTDPNSTRAIGTFAQFSQADSHVALMDQHIGTGFQWTGPIPINSRATDVLGLGPTWVRFSNESPAIKRYELAIESFYKLRLTPWFDIQPDLQYIINPGGTRAPNALVTTLRAELNF